MRVVKESVTEGIFGKFDTGAGFKGNGMTIYDRNQEKAGDYKDIAHIAPNGKITIYDKNVKKEPKLMQSLKKISQEFRTTFKESVLSVTEGEKREASNIMRKYDLAFIKFSREIRDVIKLVDRSTGSKVDGKIIEKAYEKALIPLNKLMQEWDRGQQQNPGLSEDSVVNENNLKLQSMMKDTELGKVYTDKDKPPFKVQEDTLNERITKAFIVHPTDPSETEKNWVERFKELAQGHGVIIDYGPGESDMYDWNNRSYYTSAIEEYNKMMNKVANGLNKSLDEMNNIWREWDKIYKKYLKKDGRK